MAAKVGNLVGKPVFKAVHTPHSDFVENTTQFGVEVEAERAILPSGYSWDGMHYWNPHVDDSLRDNGCEYTFVKPLFGTDARIALMGLCDMAKRRGFRISGRCGLHVHIDVRDMGLVQFKSFCVLYSILEKLIYRWVGDNREDNIFCLPWYHAEGDLNSLCTVLDLSKDRPDGLSPEVHDVFINMQRYAGLNLNAVAKFGSAEFRHMKTTFDYERIKTWINILLSLKQAANLWTGSSTQLLDEVRILGCRTFINKVFRKDIADSLWYTGADRDIHESGLVTADYIIQKSSNNSTPINFKHLYGKYKKLRGVNVGYSKWASSAVSKLAKRLEKTEEKEFEELPPDSALAAAGWPNLNILNFNVASTPTGTAVPIPDKVTAGQWCTFIERYCSYIRPLGSLVPSYVRITYISDGARQFALDLRWIGPADNRISTSTESLDVSMDYATSRLREDVLYTLCPGIYARVLAFVPALQRTAGSQGRITFANLTAAADGRISAVFLP